MALFVSRLRLETKRAPGAREHPRGPTKPDEEMGADPPRPSRGLRSDATRRGASRHPAGPLLESRGTPGTQAHSRLDGHGFRPTRAAFRRPPGIRGGAPPEPACAGRGPPLHFRSPTEAHRNTPAPSRRSEDRLAGRCFLSWAFVPYDTCRSGGPAFRGASGPAACRVRGLVTSIAASTTAPPDARRRRSVHGLPPSRPCSARRSASLSGALPSGRWPRRFASPPWGACGRGRLQGLSPDAQPCVAGSLAGPVAPLPSWGRSLQSVLPLRTGHPLWVAEPPLARIGRCDVPSRLRLRVFGSGGIGLSLSGPPALLGFATS